MVAVPRHAKPCCHLPPHRQQSSMWSAKASPDPTMVWAAAAAREWHSLGGGKVQVVPPASLLPNAAGSALAAGCSETTLEVAMGMHGEGFAGDLGSGQVMSAVGAQGDKPAGTRDSAQDTFWVTGTPLAEPSVQPQ